MSRVVMLPPDVLPDAEGIKPAGWWRESEKQLLRCDPLPEELPYRRRASGGSASCARIAAGNWSPQPTVEAPDSASIRSRRNR